LSTDPFSYLNTTIFMISSITPHREVIFGLPRFGPLPTYPVSDTYLIRVRVWFACDTHPIHQLAYRSILTTPIHSDTLRFVTDTSMIFFSRYFGGFGEEYTHNTCRYAPILLWYISEWNLYNVLCVAIAFQLFTYQYNIIISFQLYLLYNLFIFLYNNLLYIVVPVFGIF
jgi:hypothetical protein